MEFQFEWDDDKAAENLRKHGISFREAATSFDEVDAVTIADPEHSETEERYWHVGWSLLGNLLIVVYTERDDFIRIISARKVTPSERRIYYEEQSPD